MPQIDQLDAIFASQLFWLIVVFGIIYFGIGRGMVPKIQGVVEQRDRQIAEDLEGAQRAREEAEKTEADYRSAIDASRSEAMKLAQEAKQKAAGLPRCARGAVFRAEAVPTDVEVGPDGNLYVTSLPGGPEDGSLGANGRVYQVSPSTGDVTRLPGPGLVSPTGIAIAPDGTAYISMLFAGLVMKVPFGGTPEVFANVPFPGDVDYANGSVYVTRTDLTNEGDTPPDGAVLEFAP